MAGWGTRMRPHTWSKPKPLVGVGGRTALDYLLDMFRSLPDPDNTEFIFILGPYLGEEQIPPFIAEHYPELKARYVVQAEMKGQSHALYLARQYLNGPMIMCFSDTLIEADFAFLDRERSDGVAWVKAVPDPRRFGVAEVDQEGWIKRLVEKPRSLKNNLALVGCYYFRNSEDLMSAIEEQMRRDLQLKNEFFLADAINIMLQRRALFRAQHIETWLDTGTIQSTLETNRFLLERMQAAGQTFAPRKGVRIKPPVFIHETALIEHSTIGPYVSVAANCRITDSRIENSILEADCEVTGVALKGSVLGCEAKVQGGGAGEVMSLNVGDHSTVLIGAAA